MPQPAISLEKYLSATLPAVKQNFPAGGGATGDRKPLETKLKGVSKIDDFEGKVKAYIQTLPAKPIPADPAHPFPHFLTVTPNLPKEVKSAQDVQQYIKQLPLSALSSSLTALSAHTKSITFPETSSGTTKGSKLDAAGYESDGGETPGLLAKEAKIELGQAKEEEHAHEDADAGKEGKGRVDVDGVNWGWRFSKSPLGSGEFLLIDEKNPEKVHLVVRTINISAFSSSDWDEFVFEGPYHYNTKSKASWYHSRIYSAAKRLGCKYFVFTDYQRWLFGVFSEDQEHVNISAILPFSSKSPTILESLLFWTRSATTSDEATYKVQVKDVSSKEGPYENVTDGKAKKEGVSLDAESDIEE